jgi:hypothetical protein
METGERYRQRPLLVRFRLYRTIALPLASALEIGERFAVLANSVQRLEGRRLDHLEQLDFANRAVSLRFGLCARRSYDTW